MKQIAYGALFLLLLFPLSRGEGAKASDRASARLNYISGEIYIQKPSEMDYIKGDVDMPILEGYRLGTINGRAEIDINRNQYIRLDKQTKIDILKLPGGTSGTVHLRILAGNVYLRVKKIRGKKSIEIQTSDVSAYILEKGLYRFDIREN